MSESKTWFCRTEEDTAEIGRKLASIARRGDCFALYGTLGMGKSVLCRAFIRSLADAGEVPSPTFTLVQSYPAEEFEIYHFDLYRLKSPEEIFELGMEEALCEGVCLIEWPSRIEEVLPDTCENIWIEKDLEKGFDYRKITVTEVEA